MVTRINFLAAEETAFTYLKMGKILAGFCIALAVAFGGISFRGCWMGKEIRGQDKLLKELENQKEKFKVLFAQGGGASTAGVASVVEKLKKTPKWSEVMETISKAVPGPLHLRHLELTRLTPEALEFRVELSGGAPRSESILTLAKFLRETGKFLDVTLKSSEQDKDGAYLFVLEARVGV